jgi:hypothetical protein
VEEQSYSIHDIQKQSGEKSRRGQEERYILQRHTISEESIGRFIRTS